MKNLFIIFAFLAVVCNMQAQEKVMTIDNQTPGWLSSKMTYDQQVNVEDLTITGYVNKTDMEFINGLANKRKLKKLNLHNVNTINDNNEDNYLWEEFIHCNLTKLIMPSKILYPGTIKGNIDSLYIRPDKLLKDNFYPFEIKKSLKHLFIEEGTDSIPKKCFQIASSETPIIHLPNSIKYIGIHAFCNYSNTEDPFTLPNELVSAGGRAFKGGFYGTDYSSFDYEMSYWLNSSKITKYPVSKERFEFPKNLRYYVDCRHILESDTIIVNDKCDSLFVDELNSKIAYFLSKNPTEIKPQSLRTDILYVPTGCKETYEKKYKKIQNIGTIKEIPTVQDIEISPSEIKDAYINDEIQLTAKILPTDAYDKTLIWSSNNESVATVTDNGLVKIHDAGLATITAKSAVSGIIGKCTVSATKHVESILLDKKEANMWNGEKLTLEVTVSPQEAANKRIRCHSSNENVVTAQINDGDMRHIALTACNPGFATITVETEDGSLTATCSITVKQQVTNISINTKEITLNVGESEKIEYDIEPYNATEKEINWTSNNPSVATVSSDGTISAITVGNAKITATTTDGTYISDYCTVTVNQPVTGIELSENEIKLSKIGSSVQLYAKITPDDATNKNANWSSSNENICRVSQTGLVTATGYGTSVIFATTEEKGYMASCVVTVENIDGINNPTIGTPYYIKDNSLFVKEQYNTDYTIVSVDGKLIHKGTEQKITLKSGIYILYINGKRYKINI